MHPLLISTIWEKVIGSLKSFKEENRDYDSLIKDYKENKND